MGKNDYEITLSNCRNVARLEAPPLIIKKNALNVFYGCNGTGKTTLCKALEHIFNPTDESIRSLASFRFLETNDKKYEPVATSATRIRDLAVFNDEWVDSHCFQESTLHKDAYELYVRDAETRKLEKQRRQKLNAIRGALTLGDYSELRVSLSELQKAIGRLKSNGEFVARAPAIQAFKGGVPIESVPRSIRSVTKGMTAAEKAKWLKWHIEAPIVHDSDTCPYCGVKDKARQIACREYDSSRDASSLKQWESIASAYEKFGPRLSRGDNSLLRRVLISKKPPTDSEMALLGNLANKVNDAIEALSDIDDALQDAAGIDASVLVDRLRNDADVLVKCNLFLKTKQGKRTQEWSALSRVINAISALKTSQAELDAVSAALRNHVAASIAGHEHEINRFLKQCGYRYEMRIECNPQTGNASVLLRSLSDPVGHAVTNPDKTLSYGERNTLGLMMFMFEAIHRPYAFIVLDDPISSFDLDKRYGILFALFAENGTGVFSQNLRGRSVLLLTHDFLVVSDLIGIKASVMPKVCGSFLRCDGDEVLHCQPLDDVVIVPYTKALFDEIRNSTGGSELLTLVRIRQLSELLRRGPNDKKTKRGWTFKLLSGIVHGRSADEILAEHKWADGNRREVRMCENYVSALTLSPFDYWKAVERYSDCMKELIDLYDAGGLSSVDKLTVVRLMIERDYSLAEGWGIMKRFADEACHVGGNYLFQPHGADYDQVPFYVIEWCDEVVARAKLHLVQ